MATELRSQDGTEYITGLRERFERDVCLVVGEDVSRLGCLSHSRHSEALMFSYSAHDCTVSTNWNV